MNNYLNYRHIFHAGNFADVHKHTTLTLLLLAMQRKPKPFVYLETHSGAGLYDLRSSDANRSLEWKNGIDRIWGNTSPQLTHYLAIIAKFNDNNKLRYYPGSPLIAQSNLRIKDRSILLEASFPEAEQLATTIKKYNHGIRALVRVGDGYAALNAWLPPKEERRGIIFIDPPFERNDEFKTILHSLLLIKRLFATCCVIIWYPLKELRAIANFHQALKDSGLNKLLVTELRRLPNDVAGRFHGSGLLLHNPPWQFENELNVLGIELAKNFAIGNNTGSQVYWLD